MNSTLRHVAAVGRLNTPRSGWAKARLNDRRANDVRVRRMYSDGSDLAGVVQT
jgi:hypothetical protein